MEASLLGELSCSVCLETYTDPVALPCMHSYCRQCLLDISNSTPVTESLACSADDKNTARQQKERVINCPECRHVVILDDRGIAGLPKNFTLSKLVEKCLAKENKDQEPEIPCSVCDVDPPRPAMKNCMECKLSYCSQCIQYVHPKRGAFISHRLVEPDQVPKDSDNVKQTNSVMENFCQTCDKVVSGEKCGHAFITVEDGRRQKLRMLESITGDMEMTRREYRQDIYDFETLLDQIQVDERRQTKDVSQSMERVTEMLQNKESDLKRQVKKNSIGLTEQMKAFLEKRQRDLNELSELINIGKGLLEESKCPSFIEKVSDLSCRQAALTARTQSKKDKESLRISHAPVNEMKDMENAIAALMETKNSHGVGLESQIAKKCEDVKKVKIISADPVWNFHTGILKVTWEQYDTAKAYDVKLKRLFSNGETELVIITEVRTTERTVDNLQQDCVYLVSVMVHGCPESESEVLTSTTLPKIVYSLFTFDVTNASEDVKFSSDGNTMVDAGNCDIPDDKLMKIIGARSSLIIGDTEYWEVKSRFFMGRVQINGGVACSFGICDDNQTDRVDEVYRNYSAYVCSVARRGRNMANLEFDHEGKKCSFRRALTWEKPFNVHLGFFLNLYKRQFSIIDVQNQYLLYTFENIKQCNYSAVFTINDNSNQEVTLLTGPQIRSVPPTVYKDLL